MSDKIDSFFSELELFGIKLGLDQTEELLTRIGKPQEKLKFIHLAGSNGKGSVGAMLSAALTGAGFKTGFYSSPHLISIRERFRIDGKAISAKRLEEIIQHIAPHICEMRRNNASPTYFEVTTAVAAEYFAEGKCDYVIWETGMGGRFDATNIVTPELTVITGIGMDHPEYLGDSLEKIAFEKAGIIKEGVPLFCGELDKESEKVILGKAKEMNSECQLYSEAQEVESHVVPLLGEHQKKNAKLAIQVLKYLAHSLGFDLEESLKYLKNLRWPGRFQVIDERIIIDGAHNPQAVEMLVSSLCALFPGRKFSVIFASMADKDTINVLKELAPITEEFIFPQVKSSRRMLSPDELIELAGKSTGIGLKKACSLRESLKVASNDNILITGSLYLAGDALKELVKPSEVLNIY